jgi:hypothetical protein
MELSLPTANSGQDVVHRLNGELAVFGKTL